MTPIECMVKKKLITQVVCNLKFKIKNEKIGKVGLIQEIPDLPK